MSSPGTPTIFSGDPMSNSFAHPDEIRTLFSLAMSEMYRAEVPQYGTLTTLVSDINEAVLLTDPALRDALANNGELDRLAIERHGAIRLGTREELFTMRRLFALMDMHPVGYYDLSAAGVPVHSTAFRPIGDESLRQNPFRVFTSLLRLELIEDEALRAEAAAILSRRRIFTRRILDLIGLAERKNGLSCPEAEEFVAEALFTFRWHRQSTVSIETYRKLSAAHRLIADVVSFNGPHINHLTPRTLDIDAVQAEMPRRGITPKAVIEGPPPRACPILLRQTSFKALEEPIVFQVDGNGESAGTHTARFGEIEQRGVALTPAGRKLYDDLLASVRAEVRVDATGGNSSDYNSTLAARFAAFPDDWPEMRRRDLAFFRYSVTEKGHAACGDRELPPTLDALVAAGLIRFDPIMYEDFLPVSAAGIFQSNLGTDEQQDYGERTNKAAFEAALGSAVQCELQLYAEAQKRSIDEALAQLGQPTFTRSPAA
jgi:uncharacterized glyoxalase superfamily metalloenzyme YdcJ